MVDKSKILGRGGFGDVYVAKYLGSQVACKVVHIRTQVAATALRGFVGEVSVMTKLHHPNIILIMGVVDSRDDRGGRTVSIVTELMGKVREGRGGGFGPARAS